MALLLAALIFVQQADASTTEQERRLTRPTLLQTTNPILRLTTTLAIHKEADSPSRALFARALLLFGQALALAVGEESSST